ncbi:MAG: ABC transporter ATP-binding protein [Bacteroidales bacterium]|jgi:iron complex transport system ATP-binding protein|nr:ABC transporter ATP-binding protein [Bacteroidales bacterium]
MLLKTNALSIGYDNYIVQENLNLAAESGGLICLIGTNGSGKSTLLRTLGGLQKPLSGNICINGQMVVSLSNDQRSKMLSLVLTDPIDDENMTVFDLVSLGRFPYTNWIGTLSEKDRQMIATSIAQVNLTSKTNAHLNEISDGEKQRAIIAKALTQDTPLVLLDEPTAHLDLPNRIEIMLLLQKLSVNTRKTFILSTHELDLAMQMADNIWLINASGIETGIPEDLMLSGKLQQIFGNDSFYFDKKDGHFSVYHLLGNLQVQISGEEIPVIWTSRALNRFGIKITNDAKIQIIANHHQILMRQSKTDPWQELHSIEALLYFFKTNKTNEDVIS